KTCKPQRDRDLDLPTIGPATVAQCAAAGMAGIVIEAGASIVAERDKLVDAADAAGIFVYGARVKDYL
ncbi:MAG TPA: UDP-2,3-diacylglucosamine diphosphatase LpxI, partial [Alphaproteobacteria bacterium]|nr:UDP-2,3-diacylglucosamine diphosphatase LpxI [Alphaproteobacteria bacterium]